MCTRTQHIDNTHTDTCTYTHTHTHAHNTHTHTQHTINAQAASHTGRLWIPTYICSYIALVNTETQTGIIHRYTSGHTQVVGTQTQVLGQHFLFEYNTARHSWRRLHTVSVCAKLSYARDSWQTLAQMIHGLPKLGRCSSHYSEAAL